MYILSFISYNHINTDKEVVFLEELSTKLADTAILAGQIMLECNAESYRIEDTMNFILRSSGFKTCDAYAMATAIFVTIDDPRITNISIVKRVKYDSTNLKKISQVNDISRQLSSNSIDLDTAYENLNALKIEKHSPKSKYIGLMAMSGSFAGIFNGGPIEVLVATLAAGILPLVDIIDRKLKLGFFVSNILSLVPIVALIVMIKNNIFSNLSAGISIIGVIMPFVPGTAITNAIRDTFRGDYISGGARFLESFAVALSVAIGVALGLILSGGYDLL